MNALSFRLVSLVKVICFLVLPVVLFPLCVTALLVAFSGYDYADSFKWFDNHLQLCPVNVFVSVLTAIVSSTAAALSVIGGLLTLFVVWPYSWSRSGQAIEEFAKGGPIMRYVR